MLFRSTSQNRTPSTLKSESNPKEQRKSTQQQGGVTWRNLGAPRHHHQPNQTQTGPAALTGRRRRLRRWMATGPVGLESSLQALHNHGGPAAVQRREGGGRSKNGGGGRRALTGATGRLRPPFSSILAPFSSFLQALQNPRIKSLFPLHPDTPLLRFTVAIGEEEDRRGCSDSDHHLGWFRWG